MRQEPPTGGLEPRSYHPGSGHPIGAAMGVRAFSRPERYLRAREHLYHEWRTYPTGHCACTHRIWVAAEHWEPRGFRLLFSPLPRFYVWYFWHYEVACEPAAACPTSRLVHDGNRLQPYANRARAPTSPRDILAFVADVAGIVSLAFDLANL